MTNKIKSIHRPVWNGSVTDREGKTHKCNYLSCEVYYSLGGYNGFTGKNEGRGYYISVSPVTITPDGLVSYTLFSGVKKLVVPCNRKSKGKAEEAERIFDGEIAELVNLLYPNNGIDFKETEAA